MLPSPANMQGKSTGTPVGKQKNNGQPVTSLEREDQSGDSCTQRPVKKNIISSYSRSVSQILPDNGTGISEVSLKMLYTDGNET